VARAALHNNTKQPPALQEGSVCVCFDTYTYAWGLQLIHGDGSRSSCVSMRYVAQPGRFSLVRSVAAEPRCNSAHQDADYWSLLLHHSALSSSPAVRTHYFSFSTTSICPSLSCAASPASSTADCQSICFVPHLFRKHGPYHSHRPVMRGAGGGRGGGRCPATAAWRQGEGWKKGGVTLKQGNGGIVWRTLEAHQDGQRH